MGSKGQHHRKSVDLPSAIDNSPDKGTVSQMLPIKIANGENRADSGTNRG
ncbi:MAG: hypothetical protein NPIRA06_11220 [Nitrospirales bacterium]|nr:MAG: hypothetical protein NPIRA06_11220 [Nitrospirales bacterium]